MTAAPLVLAAHGSSDRRYATVIDELAERVSTLRPELDVRIGYLEHGPPDLSAVVEADCVVVPLLLSGGFHLYVDLPAQAPGCLVTPAIGPDPGLSAVLSDRLRAAGWQREQPLVLAATGSSDPRSLADVERAAAHLGRRLGLVVTAAYLSAGTPRLDDVAPAAVASYLLAPGRFSDVVASCGAPVVAAPLGADPRIAALILDRYDDARDQAGRRPDD